MHFRARWIFSEPHITYEDGLQLRFDNQGILVQFCSPNSRERQKWHARNACTTTTIVEPPETVTEVLNLVEGGTLTRGSLISPDYFRSIVLPADGDLEKDRYLVTIDDLCTVIRPFMTKLYYQLAACAHKTVRLMRWRFNLNGRHSPCSFSSMEWSSGSLVWHELPIMGETHAELSLGFEVTEETIRETEELANDGINEPIHHEFFREAWHQRFQNPRSALALGVAALEVGVKACISTLVPDADWLVSELPSPPVAKLIKNYLPLLPVKATIGGQVLIPPRSVRRLISEAVELRNVVVHTGAAPVQKEELEQMLTAIKDVLWLLDYYQGHTWALEHVRTETRNSLEVPT